MRGCLTCGRRVCSAATTRLRGSAYHAPHVCSEATHLSARNAARRRLPRFNDQQQQTTTNKKQTKNKQETGNRKQQTTDRKQRTANSKQQPANNNQQPTTNNQQPTNNNQQPTTNNRQPTTDNQQPTTNNKQQTTNNQQPTTNSHKHKLQPTNNRQQTTSNKRQPATTRLDRGVCPGKQCETAGEGLPEEQCHRSSHQHCVVPKTCCLATKTSLHTAVKLKPTLSRQCFRSGPGLAQTSQQHTDTHAFVAKQNKVSTTN